MYQAINTIRQWAVKNGLRLSGVHTTFGRFLTIITDFRLMTKQGNSAKLNLLSLHNTKVTLSLTPY